MICLFEGEHHTDPVERLQEAFAVGAGLQNNPPPPAQAGILIGEDAVKTGARPADLCLEDLGRGDGECHKLVGLLHCEAIRLVHRHAADCQRFGVVAASFGQTHVPFENVQHNVLFNGGGHYNTGQNVLNSAYIYFNTFLKIISAACQINRLLFLLATKGSRLPVGHMASIL